MLRDPAGDALAELELQRFERLVLVFPDTALHRDGIEVVAVEPVDANVVVVDELAELGRDRLADLLDARQAAEPRAELLDRLELRRPRRELGVVPGRLDRDGRLGGERGHRLELVLGPRVWLVVIGAEDAERLQAIDIEERGDADGVEALLDDGRSEVADARVVAIVNREHGAARVDRGGAERRALDARDGRDPGSRQAAGRGHAPRAVLLEEECGDSVRGEQGLDVVDKPVEDLVEVEPAADVAGDPAKSVGALQLMRDVRGGRGGTDDAADRRRRDTEELPLRLRRDVELVPDEEEHAPGLNVAGDCAGELPAGQVRRRQVVVGVGVDDPRRVRERGAEDAVRDRQAHKGLRDRSTDRDRGKPCVLPAPGRDVGRARCVPDRVDGRLERRVRAGQRVTDRRPADRRELTDEVEHGLVVLERDDGAATPAGGPLVEGLDRRQRNARVARGQEPLEVAHAVAPVAPGVDPGVP